MAIEHDGPQYLTVRGVVSTGFIGGALLIWQTTVQTWVDTWGYGPQWILIVLFFISLYGPLPAGAITSVVLGFLADVMGGGPFGFSAGVYLVAFIIVLSIRHQIDPAAPAYLVLFFLLFILGIGVLSLLAFKLLDWPVQFAVHDITSPAAVYLISSLVTTLLAPILIWVLNRFLVRGRT